MQQAILRLFRAVQIVAPNPGAIPRTVAERTIRNGYLLDPAITPSEELLDEIDAVMVLSGEQANAAFHKSWEVVRDSSMESLFVQQATHYITTYGFRGAGIYQREIVYIPQEVLAVPDIQDDIPLTVVRAVGREDVLEAVVRLGSGIALAPETLADIMCIVVGNQYDVSLVHRVENRELKAQLNDHFGLVPQEPVEFLRHLIRKLTGETLLIKNDALIAKIKASDGACLDPLLKRAPESFPGVFYRYKPLLLALKSISQNKNFFNRLRKQAPRWHEPLKEDYLNSVTQRLKRNTMVEQDLRTHLNRASVFRKIRLAYALQYRLRVGTSIVFRVRNGLGWATDFDWPEQLGQPTQAALDSVFESLVADLRPHLAAKTILIPDQIRYALPASEKQFIGNLPCGTSVRAPESLIVGVHWKDTRREIDLDLSMIGESGKFGWDGEYRSEERDVLFSGDMTEAPEPNGATELFHLLKGPQESKILMLNFYNYQRNDSVEAQLLVANEKPERWDLNYMVDPNNIVLSARLHVSKKQTILGLIASRDDELRVYFSNVSVGTSITSSNDRSSEHARSFLVRSQLESFDLKEILIRAGARVTTQRTGDEDVDLSPHQLDKATILRLLTGAL